MTGKPKSLKRDGRHARTDTTRRSILNTCRKIVIEGGIPTAAEVASKAGITTRTLFRHFADVESLHGEVIDQAIADAQAVMDEPIPDEISKSASYQEKLVHIIYRRSRVYESLLPVLLSPVFNRHRLKSITDPVEVKNRRKRLTSFLPADVAKDKPLFEAIDATLSVEFWISLRRDQELSIRRARQVMERAIEKLIA